MRNTEPLFSPDALAARLAKLGVCPGDTMAVALSGGLDSSVLLHALCRLPQRAPYLRALHVHHGLHPAAGVWADHCLEAAAALEIPCRLLEVSVPLRDPSGLEAAARRERHYALKSALQPGEWLLLAHHRDDLAETLLINLFRGTGIAGLASLREFALRGVIRVARPLLTFSRASLMAYASAEGIRWIEDTGNLDTVPTRNFIRHAILPALAPVFPAVSAGLARTAHWATEAQGLLDEMAREDAARCREESAGQGLKTSALLRLNPARRRNLLRHWLGTAGFDLPSARKLAEILSALERAPHGHWQIRCGAAGIASYRGVLQCYRPHPPPEANQVLIWDPVTELPLPDGGKLLALPCVGASPARSSLALLPQDRFTVRFRAGGERVRLPGESHHRPVKDLLRERGMPPWMRSHVPFVYVGDTLAAVADLLICDPFAARAGEPGLKLRWTHAD